MYGAYASVWVVVVYAQEIAMSFFFSNELSFGYEPK